jgi:hypothetical protein
MLFLWLNKTPPKWDPPLSIQEGFDMSFLKYYFLPLLNIIGKPIDNILGNTKFLKLVVVRSFCFGLLLSPPLAWIAKNGIIRALEVLSSPLVINKWVEITPKTKSGPFALGSYSFPKDEVLFFDAHAFSPPRMESDMERWRRTSYGVEAFVFAEDSNSLSIHLWLGLKFTWKYISHCWGLVLNSYELRTRQHKVLNVNVLRPWNIIPLRIMGLGRRLIRA